MQSTFGIGDQITVKDGSWSFGIRNGEFSDLWDAKTKAPFIVLKTNLSVMKSSTGIRTGSYHEICDLLVKDKNGNFWFTQSHMSKLFVKTHPIIVASKTVQISDESYQALKKAIG